MLSTSYTMQRTKQYLIDLLNGVFFSGRVHWDSVDVFNSLPVVLSDQDSEGDYLRKEVRAGLLVHRRHYYGCRLSICAETGYSDRVCYRLSPLKTPVKLDDANRIVFPMKNKFDISLSDLNLGADDHSAYCYYNASMSEDGERFQSSVFSVLKFILDTDIVVSYIPELFDSLQYEKTTQIPLLGDIHYTPVFGVSGKEDEL